MFTDEQKPCDLADEVNKSFQRDPPKKIKTTKTTILRYEDIRLIGKPCLPWYLRGLKVKW
jgi:hypothetical protein